ncbi:MAG: Acetoacetate metabolism regulatory protein atoC [Candidatus Magnetoglobus multicellularis str. Araruama]|uniref:Acetoacetate metabolism regulatory protein atoC n=1 Tax=Candidatus Magnetoglobus multicellularis str. Araruama TaxID=890399 RepID=A0A1V1P0D5_9BACT|nr:MAG: Acetoacetate metabolism regulatory protein atoC [Candidatus Magnetoglobus multicellularis str. Araruama]
MAEAKTKSILYQGQQIQMIALRNITDNIRLERENVSLMSSVSNNHRLGDMVGKSKVMKRIFKKIIQLAASDEPVLISGEGGTGKKLAAHNIHLMSSRAKKACVLVNCSTLSDSLFEIAFFGYQKGAFKRAISNNAGFFEKANKGILLLDKIDTLSIKMQDKLLHVIETGEYRPLGGNIKNTRFRIISTTNKNLKYMVDQGKMLPDFFHFLNVLSLIKPPLRDRKEDIPTLVKFFVENNQSLNPNKGIITDCIMDKLIEYNWPGNVAELFNELKQYLTGKLDEKSANILPHKFVSISNLFFDLNENITLADAVARFEQCYIQQILDMNNGRKNKTSEILGVDPRTLYNKMNRKETS